VENTFEGGVRQIGVHMNRKARHAAKKTAFVHEAGHCVGRVLVAGSLGWDIYEAIDGIDIVPNLEATTPSTN